jgi:hypothetical protein
VAMEIKFYVHLTLTNLNLKTDSRFSYEKTF